MKLFKLLIGIALLSVIACKNEKPKNTEIKKEKTVQHYICQNNCENSGSEVAGNCPSCKTQYLHNQSFHKDDLLNSGPLKVDNNAAQPAAATQAAPQTSQPSPAQNALGVYHYTCSNGCTGGAGTAANCNACGEALAHNTAYHN